MAKGKKKASKKPAKKKGIVDPRIAERKAAAAQAAADKAAADARLQQEVEVEGPARAARVREAVPKQEAPEVTPPTKEQISRGLEDTRPLGYGGAPIPQTERQPAKLDAASVADDALEAAAIREDEKRQALIDSGETLEPRTPRAVIESIQARRAKEEADRVANLKPVELESNVGAFEEVTPGEAARRAAERTPRLGTGLVDFKNMTSGGRPQAGLSEFQQAGAVERSRLRGRKEDVLTALGDETGGNRLITDEDPAITSLAKRLKASSLMDQGKEVTEADLSDSTIQNSHHQRVARIMHYTGVSEGDLSKYLGKRESIAYDKANELHETVMRNVRSRRKIDVASQMGLQRNEDGSFSATEAASGEMWQHPTEKEKDGITPKVYKVSDMHPDMLRQLKHNWGGYRSENAFEGTAVVKQTPAISAKAEKNPSLRYSLANRITAGDEVPVSMFFGHNKNAAGAWTFTEPPKGVDTGNPEGFTSNVTHIMNAIKEGRTRSSRKSHAEIANSLVADMDPNKQRRGGSRQIAVPMPGFTETGGAPAKTGYEPVIHNVPPAGDDNIVSYDDLPHVKDEHGNLVPLAPRSGRAGTGRSVQVTQGPSLIGSVSSAAEESAKTLMGFEVTPEEVKTHQRKKKDGSEVTVTRRKPGVISNVAEGAIAAGTRSAGIRNLLRGNRAVGQQFQGVKGLEPEFRAKRAQGILPGFEKFGNTEVQSGIRELKNTRVMEGPIPEEYSGKEITNPREKSGLLEQTRVLPADRAETLNTARPDSRTLRLRAEAESGRTGITGTDVEPAPESQWQQQELDFNPKAPGVVNTRQFMLGNIRGLTDAERGVENAGANTIRGMNPPAKNFLVGAPTATAAPATTEPAVSSGVVELSRRDGERSKPSSEEKVEGTTVLNKGTGKRRGLKRPPNSANL